MSASIPVVITCNHCGVSANTDAVLIAFYDVDATIFGGGAGGPVARRLLVDSVKLPAGWIARGARHACADAVCAQALRSDQG
jgi:hypothetical protein